MRRGAGTMLIAVALLGLAPASASAATWGVDDPVDTPVGQNCPSFTNCSLREAVTSANANSGADAILVAAGTYPLPNGQIAVTQDLEISRVGAGAGIAQGAGSRLFDVTGAGVDLHLRFMILESGAATGDGGAIRAGAGTTVTVGSTTIRNSTVSGTSARGGAIYSAGSVSVGFASSSSSPSPSEITGNTATASGGDAAGGGIFVDTGGALTVSDSIVAGNSATGSAKGTGGGVYADTVSVTGSTFSGNVASGGGQARGGGLYAGTGAATLTRSTVSGNTAHAGNSGTLAEGGGLALGSTGVNTASVSTLLSTFSGNTAEVDPVATGIPIARGGAIHNESRNATSSLTSTTIAGNTASGPGSTDVGGGLSGGGTNAQTAFTVAGSIVAENTQATSSQCDAATVTSGGYNVLGPLAGCAYTAGTGDATGVADAGLNPLANNGGPTQTILPGLAPMSVAVDRIPGANALCTAQATDQRGVARPNQGACDSGAAERPYLARDDTATVAEDSGFTVISIDGNDDDAASEVTSVSDPANGTAQVHAPAGTGIAVRYQPDPNYCNAPPGTAPDTFIYTRADGEQAMVSVTVNCLTNTLDPTPVTPTPVATAPVTAPAKCKKGRKRKVVKGKVRCVKKKKRKR